jgi:hypothetical protein
LTVTESVIVADAPAARLPAQVRFGAAKDTVPAVAVAAPLFRPTRPAALDYRK